MNAQYCSLLLPLPDGFLRVLDLPSNHSQLTEALKDGKKEMAPLHVRL
jgi:hypothetical protein